MAVQPNNYQKINSNAAKPVGQAATGLAATQRNSSDPNPFNQRNNSSNNNKVKPEKKERNIVSLILGAFGFFNFIPITTDLLENPIAMATRHLTNAYKSDDPSIPDGHPLKKFISEQLETKSGILKRLKPLTDKLGYTHEKHNGYDGWLSLVLRGVQSVVKGPLSLLGLKTPFNLPDDVDPNVAVDAKTDFNFKAHQDMTVIGEDEEGQAIFKNPRGHILQWNNQVNPNPEQNADPKRSWWLKWNSINASRAALSFLFNAENGVRVLFEKSPKNLGAYGKLLNTLKFATAGVSTLTGPISTFASWIFSYYGRKNMVTAANLWGLSSGIMIPTNHGLELGTKIISAWNTAKKEGRKVKEVMKEMDIWNPGKLAHGVFGGLVAAVPTTVGYLARMMQIYSQTRYFYVPAARDFGNIAHTKLKSLGLVKSTDSTKFENFFVNLITGAARAMKDYVVPTAQATINFMPIKFILKRIFPVTTNEETGKEMISLAAYDEIFSDIVNTENKTEEEKAREAEEGKFKYFSGAPTVDRYAKDVEKELDKKNLWLGFIPKYQSLMSLFKIFGPIPTWSVTAAYAFDPLTNKEIQSAKGPLAPLFKVADYIIGGISVAFSLPNVLLYGLGSRFTQAFTSACDLVQRYAETHDWKGKDGDKYDIMKEVVEPWTKKLLNSKISLLRFVGKNWNEDLVNNPRGKDIFTNQVKTNQVITLDQENLAFKNEYSVEVPAAYREIKEFLAWTIELLEKFTGGRLISRQA